LFNAIRGKQRESMEQARLIAFFSKVHIEGSTLSLSKFAVFPWETAQEYAPKFLPFDKDAFDRISNFKFPSDN